MSSVDPIVVTHIIVDLKAEGAQSVLYRLLSGMDGTQFTSRVITLTDVGQLAPRIVDLGIPVISLGMQHGKFSPIKFFKLISMLRADETHVIQTWMYHADLLGGLAAKLAGKNNIIWNIRHSNFVKRSKQSTVWVRQIAAWLSGWLPDRIIVNAHSAWKIHADLGYDDDKMLVIPNGFDLDTFHSDPDAKESVHAELGIAPETRIVGMVARFALQKDHRTFLRAAAKLAKIDPGVVFLLCGDQIDWANEALMTWIEDVNLRDRMHLLGHREDIPRLLAAFDIATLSSSHGEAFPNVVAEAMACEIPCVVTNSGDAAEIVGETGFVVPAKDPEALADAWEKIFALSNDDRYALGRAARLRVENNYQLSDTIKQYEKIYSAFA